MMRTVSTRCRKKFSIPLALDADADTDTDTGPGERVWKLQTTTRDNNRVAKNNETMRI
jgi:hypothetical protein